MRDEQRMRLIEMLDQSRRDGPEHEAVVCGTVRLSYADLSERVDRLAAGLVALGLGAGARVAVLSTNCHRYLASYLAAAVSRTVLVPLNHPSPRVNWAEILADSESVKLLIHPRFLPMLEAIRRQLPGFRQIVVIADEGAEGAVAYETLLNEARSSMPPLVRDPEDLLSREKPLTSGRDLLLPPD